MKYEYQNGDQMTGFVPGLIIGGIVGGLIGAAAALWFAPRSGEQTQELVRQEAIKLKQRADETVGDVRSDLETAAEDAREKVSEKVDDARHQGQRFVDEQTEKAGRTASSLRNAVADKRR